MNLSDLSINTDLVRKTLTSFIKSELDRAGYTRAVIGLSGGIDSALSLALTVEAIGKENVLALRMPYKTSSQESLNHAQLIIEKVDVQSLTIPITEMTNPHIRLNPDMSKTRKGNIMARCRMIVLYDQSEDFGGLVIGTGNKTEILLGYTTIFGDSACAINPLGDLYKTQVRQLSRAVGIPDVIVDKAPSADLWENQTDEGELGFTYEDLDKLFYLLIDQRYRVEECMDTGFNESFIRSVLKRVQRNQFKQMMPPIAKVSEHTIGYDFLYSHDWGT